MGLFVAATRAQDRQGTLIGWAVLPTATFADGPTSGQFAGAGRFGQALPLVDKQPVQGFSAVIAGPVSAVFYVMPDNGFGAKSNSADSLLRVYAVRPNFRTAGGGSASVSAAHFRTGSPLATFTPDSYITLHDPDRRLGFPLVADAPAYPGRGSIPVAPAITAGRLVTGADIDIESMRRDAQGHFWFGDEFGPFMLQADATGRILGREVATPDVFAPENPYRGERAANLGGSRGFEGMAVNRAGTMLYGLIEGVVSGDTPKTLRIHEFDIAGRRFTGQRFGYPLSSDATSIGDMTAVTDHQFLVIERNDASGEAAVPPPFKRIFMVDTARLTNGIAAKTEIVDLMNLSDPDDLNRDGQTTFTFPFITIEDVLVIDRQTLLVINDNNFPGGGGRGQFSDPTEFLLIRLPTPLPAVN
jgi:hypothetical protein